MRYFRRLLGISSTNHVTNEEVLRRLSHQINKWLYRPVDHRKEVEAEVVWPHTLFANPFQDHKERLQGVRRD